jgi:glycosyltransferase involved in cell wall biosynthesis
MHRQWGGQPNRVLTTALGLRDLGHEVVVSGPRDCELVKRARAAGLETFDDLELRPGMRPASFLRDLRALKAHLHEKKYDIVDTHGSQDTWRVYAALRGWKKSERPAFIRSRHNIFPVSGHVMNRLLYAEIDHVITVSPQVIPHLAKVMPAEKCTSIYSAPDIAGHKKLDPQAAELRRAVRNELGIAQDACVVGVVGRLAPEKGHRYLIEAAPEIARAIPSVQFVFAGQGRSRGDIEAQINALGEEMAARFHILGFRKDVPRVLRSFDVFVLPSTEGESLGTSILEAFLAELPVVATNIGGVGESVIEGKTGRLVPQGDAAALAKAVIELGTNHEVAREMALAGKRRVETYFSPEGIARETDTVYRKVLQEKAAALA